MEREYHIKFSDLIGHLLEVKQNNQGLLKQELPSVIQ